MADMPREGLRLVKTIVALGDSSETRVYERVGYDRNEKLNPKKL